MPKVLFLVLAFSACGGKVTSDEEAGLAWHGLEIAVDKALDLGMKGYSEADAATIDAHSYSGNLSGTITVTGQVDQGSSDNKGLRLDVALTDYQDLADLDAGDDDVSVQYATNPDDPPYADLKLRDMPDGTLSGTLRGDVALDGDLGGVITLDLTLDGPTEDDGAGGVQRVDGETVVQGTATNDNGGVYEIDLLN